VTASGMRQPATGVAINYLMMSFSEVARGSPIYQPAARDLGRRPSAKVRSLNMKVSIGVMLRSLSVPSKSRDLRDGNRGNMVILSKSLRGPPGPLSNELQELPRGHR
jgi:hypothetical protein